MPSNDDDLRALFTQKPVDVKRWFTVEIYQQDIGVRRYVKDFVSHDLQIESGAPRNAGETVTFEPLGLSWELPEQNTTGNIAITVNFPRIGTDFKKELKQLSPWSIFSGAECILRMHQSNIAAPKRYYYLNAQNISINNGLDVSIPATDDNPSNQRTARVYSFDDFLGLAEL